MIRARALLLACATAVLADPNCEDSPALTTIWESTSTGNSDRLIDTLIQNHDFATHRSSDCRGPLFWAFEFKNVDALALYMHLEVDLEQTDQGGQLPKDMFDGSEEDMQEFLGKSKIEELSTLLAEREEEFYSFKNDEDDYDDESESTDGVDNIDYADDEEDEEEDVGSPEERKAKLEALKAKAKASSKDEM